MTQKKGTKRFVYRPSIDALRAFRNTTAEERLEWLEQASKFVAELVPRQTREKWNKLTRS